eukprot:CAMPEP_0184752476 /NCGR_PEP_ID=MMETSP0315-20130426/43598_1 /TAXON_ID=101924 /ORGANISM="Rhodosorus marinus, Strain UTEX LB 2760" /LENGTH=575 /DNA_ID=CAMNT_0027231805 /DNA_START=57 /DNA_END=1784 /DNA_ORIENTATION=-
MFSRRRLRKTGSRDGRPWSKLWERAWSWMRSRSSFVWLALSVLFLLLLLAGVGRGSDDGSAQPGRIIVLTQKRSESLRRLLNSLQEARYGNSRVELDIHIDAIKGGGGEPDSVDSEVRSVAEDAFWPYGKKTLIFEESNVGLEESWINAWDAKNARGDEVAVILEDDLEVSKDFFTWFKLAHHHYGDWPDVAAASIQRATLQPRKNESLSRGVSHSEHEQVYLYRLVGSWGFSPMRRPWIKFQEYYREHRGDASYEPVVENLVTTKWWQGGAKDSMWTQWYIRFCEDHNYFNVYAYFGEEKKALVVNHREAGEHFRDALGPDSKLLKDSDGISFEFTEHPLRLDWDGLPDSRYHDEFYRLAQRAVDSALSLSGQGSISTVVVYDYDTEMHAKSLACDIEAREYFLAGGTLALVGTCERKIALFDQIICDELIERRGPMSKEEYGLRLAQEYLRRGRTLILFFRPLSFEYVLYTRVKGLSHFSILVDQKDEIVAMYSSPAGLEKLGRALNLLNGEKNRLKVALNSAGAKQFSLEGRQVDLELDGTKFFDWNKRKCIDILVSDNEGQEDSSSGLESS